MSAALVTATCRRDRHKLCGGYRCTCACHGPDHNPNPEPPTWTQVIRSILGECIDHQHEQVGPCVYCKTCGRRLYQGTVIPAGELAELKRALADVEPAYHGGATEAEDYRDEKRRDAQS